MPSFKPSRRVVAAGLAGAVLLGLAYLAVRPEPVLAVPDGAAPGSLTTRPCDFDTETGPVAADCGTLVVPENRRDPATKMIALPVTRIRAAEPNPGEPIFRLGGGPGATNMNFPQASRLIADHDVVMVGYRGVDGSRRLDCPEVVGSMRGGDGIAAAKTLPATTKAFELCAKRLTADGADLTGYSVAQRVDDLEDARTALGYQKINLLSTSAGTRTAMIYSWRHPASLNRSAMIAVNPPGHLFWDPATTDSQFGQYAELCRADAGCSARTSDLAASVRSVATAMPESWGPLSIKDTNVRVVSQYAMHHNGHVSAPNNAPTVLDAYLSGDTGALWAMSVLGDVVLPESLVWGEFASFAMLDAEFNQRYHDAGGDPGSILGNVSTDFLWAGAGVQKVWPDSPDNAEYRTMRPSDVETLVISGEVDFSTPSQNATKELLPALSRGKQVVLPGLGHTYDFWEHRPDAGKHLLTTFFGSGQVDSSGFDRRPIAFDDVPLSMSTLARLLIGAVVGGAVLGLLVLAWLFRRSRRQGFTARASVWTRVAAALPLGLGGWLLGVLVSWTLNPDDFLVSATVIVPGTGVLIGLGAHLACVRPEWTARARRTSLVAAVGAALLGALLGTYALPGLTAPATAIVGAVAATNLALLLSSRNVSPRAA
ncbi:alpha/beta fold hydrolase [Lentzea sp. BCCO 10_0061]|uniref:Alpha/beta fold hydrolase n=1 Tax=Lentzea sokolovensis TaxID=3095429 RepID=A0ABU4UQN1_9PSEU|nr:alpha/beta fold hydrolase [Lentzea sp. BCCO 10_0061]MDX8141585.1 alpha/beta fold hydrolase [Lentzea sp. BCCO 10_0061]